jgi:hypothetical protein
VNVTFDYEIGAFVPVEDGEFVVVTHTDDAILLPRAAKFSTRRDFYEYYQDYYHCANPDAGDVQIITPALVAPAGNGWTLETTGLLEVIKEQPKPKPVVTPVVQPPPVKREVRREEVATAPPPPPAPAPAAEKEQPGARACPDCGSMIEAKYAFCWKCGHAMDNERKPSASSGCKPTTLLSAAMDLDDELTVQHETRPLSSTMFSWTTPSEPQRPASTTRGSVLKLMSIGGIALLALSLGIFGVLRSNTQTASATVAPAGAQPAPQVAVAQPATFTTEVSRSAPAETTTQQAAATPDEELKKLRERSKSASASERSKIFQAIAKVEKQYPRDYRFPYERAKLVAKGAKKREAFKALNVAAEKAINTGKANEMLSGLETDKTGDFSEISQGRYEWSRIVAALKRKDPSLLSE